MEQQDTELKKRFSILIGEEKPFAWAKKVGLGKSSFHRIWHNETTAIQNKTAIKIANTTGANADWIQTGKGEPFPKQREQAIAGILANAPSPFVNTPEDSEKRVQIPLYDVRLCCGDGLNTFEFEPLKKTIGFDESFFEKRNRKPENCALLYAKNDSMQYYICDGDAVMIDKSVITPTDGKVYAIWFEGEAMFKRIFKESGNTLILSADNKRYRDKIVTEDNGADFRIIGEMFYRSG